MAGTRSSHIATTPPTVGMALFDARRVTTIKAGLPLAGSSLLNPLFAWAGDSTLEEREDMILQFSDEKTNALVDASGGLARLLALVAWKTGEVWAPTASWEKVVVTSDRVAEAMRSLMTAEHQVAENVRELMRKVPDEHAFGARRVWSEITGQPEHRIGVKAGWGLTDRDTYLRSHVVVMGPERSAVVMTAVHIPATVRDQWRGLLESDGPTGVLDLHEEYAGALIRSTLTLARRPVSMSHSY